MERRIVLNGDYEVERDLQVVLVGDGEIGGLHALNFLSSRDYPPWPKNDDAVAVRTSISVQCEYGAKFEFHYEQLIALIQREFCESLGS